MFLLLVDSYWFHHWPWFHKPKYCWWCCCEKCPYSELFWSAFSHIRTVFSPNAGKYGPEELLIQTFFMQWWLCEVWRLSQDQFSTCSWLTETSKFKMITGHLLSRVCFFPEFHHYLFFPLSFPDQKVAARFIFARSKSMDLNDFLILSNALKYSIIT